MVLNKPLESIEESDLQVLVDNQVNEHKTFEYKEALPGNADGDKKEFLADISSFANASGGDLIYGIREQYGVPVELSGLQLSDVDAEILRLESCIQTGIAPRLFRIVETHSIALPSKQRYAFIIRIRKSWMAPHMVTFKNDSKFFSRNSRGKYQLDVSEIRTAFLLSETTAERIRNFRAERLMRIGAGEETPAPLDEQTPKLVLHIIPFNSFSTSVPLDLKPLNDSVKGQLLEPLMVWDSASNVNMRFNIDGIVRSVREMNSPSTIAYTQVFRNGIIETVDMSILGINARNVSQFGSSVEPRSFSGEVYERKLLATVKRYIDLQKFLDIDPPLFIMVSFLGVRSYRIAHPKFVHGFSQYTDEIDRMNLIIPEIIEENFDGDLAEAMKPIFDTVWNAAGYISSPNYDRSGKFAFGY